MRLHAGDAVENCDRAIEHTQRTFHFGREINVARSVDDVDPLLDSFENFVNAFLFALRPTARGRGGSNRNSALALLLHPIRDGGAFMHLAHLVDHSGIKQNALGDRRLAGVNVRGNSDVPRSLERELAVRRVRARRCRFFLNLPAEMSKRAIRLRHFVRVFAFLDRVALAGGSVLDFLGERLSHRHSFARVGVLHDPTHGE